MVEESWKSEVGSQKTGMIYNIEGIRILKMKEFMQICIH